MWFDFSRWLRRQRTNRKHLPVRRRRQPKTRLLVEILEDRTLPTTVIFPSDPPPPLPGGFTPDSLSGDGVSGYYQINGIEFTPAYPAFVMEIGQIIGAINDIDHDPNAPYYWSGPQTGPPFFNDAEEPPTWFRFFYTAKNPGSQCVDTQGSATGKPIFLGQHQAFNDTVATFNITSSKQLGAGDFGATIFWGDGTSSQGTITGSNNSFSVQGQHTWDLDGTYATVVDIYRTGTDCPDEPNETPWSTVTASSTLVFGLTAPQSLQTVSNVSITGSNGLTGSGGGSSFDIALNGTVNYELHYDVNELNQQTHRDVTGSLTFLNLEASGTMDPANPANATLAKENIQAGSGNETTNYKTTYADLGMEYTRTGTDTFTLDNLVKDVNFATGSYDVTEQAQIVSHWQDQGKLNQGQDRTTENSQIDLPKNIHDLTGPFTRTVDETDSFQRDEFGFYDASLANSSFARTDSHTISGIVWTQSGTDLGMTYTITANDDDITDDITTTGTIGGSYTGDETRDFQDTVGGSHITDQIQDSSGAVLTLTELDQFGFTRHVTGNWATHAFTSTETDTSNYPAAIGGTLDVDTVLFDPDFKSEITITLTGSDQTGDYTLTRTFPSSAPAPANTDTQNGGGNSWTQADSNLSDTETGNYLQNTFTDTKTEDLTTTDSESVPGADGAPAVQLNLQAIDHQKVTASGTYGGQVKKTTDDSIDNASLTTNGVMTSNATADTNAFFTRFVETAKNGAGLLNMFQAPMSTHDGTPLPLRASQTFKLPQIDVGGQVYGDVFGTFVIVGFRAGVMATVQIGTNDPVFAITGDFKGSVDVYAQVGTWAAGGFYLELDGKAQYEYYAELDNPRALPDLSSLLPPSLANGLSRFSEVLGQVGQIVNSISRPPASLPDAPASGGTVNGQDKFESQSQPTTVDPNDLSEEQANLPTSADMPDTSKASGFGTLPPLPTPAANLPSIVIATSQLTLSVSLKIGNKIVDALQSATGSTAYLQAAFSYSPIDDMTETETWYDDSGNPIQKETVQRSASTKQIMVDGQVGLQGAFLVGAAYVPFRSTNFTTVTTLTNQSQTTVTTETGNESSSSLKFFANIGKAENSLAQASSSVTETKDTTITNTVQPSYLAKRHEVLANTSKSATITVFGIITAQAVVTTSQDTLSETDTNQMQTVTINQTSNDASTKARLGQPPSGNYTETVSENGSYTEDTTTTNLTAKSTRHETGSHSSSESTSGNQLFGLTYDTTLTEQDNSTADETDTNGPGGEDVVTIHETTTDSGTYEDIGQGTSGAFTITLAGPANTHVVINETRTNHQLTDTHSETDDTTLTSYSETGNEKNGAYAINEGDSSTVTVHDDAVNQLSEVVTDTTTTATSTTSDTGNSIVSNYDVETSESGTTQENIVDTNRGRMVTTVGTITSTATSSDIGNSIAGSFSSSNSEDTNTDETVTETNHNLLTITSTITIVASANGSETGNELTGDYSGNDSESSTTTDESDQTNQQQSGNSTLTVTSSATSSETGNALTGAYKRQENDSTDETDISSQDNQGGRSSNSNVTTTASSTITETGNAVTGDYNQTSKGNTTSTENDTETNQKLKITNQTTVKTTTTGTETGNEFAGDYNSSTTDSSTSTTNGTQTNGTETNPVLLSITSNSTTTEQTTTTDIGNIFSGIFTLTIVTTGNTTDNSTETNQGLTVVTQATITDSNNSTDNGNSVTGDDQLQNNDTQTISSKTTKTNDPLTVVTDDTITVTITGSETVNENSGDYESDVTEETQTNETSKQSNSQVASFTANGTVDDTLTVTTHETGNTVVGDFDRTVTTTDSGTTTTHLANQSLVSDTTVSTDANDSADENGNTIAGDVTRTETDDVTVTTDTTSKNGPLTAHSTLTSTDHVEIEGTSNDITGNFDKTTTTHREISGDSSDTNDPLTVTGSTDGTEDDKVEENGNTLDGDYSITGTTTSSITVTQDGDNGVRNWHTEQTTDSTVDTTQSGNDLSGDVDVSVTTHSEATLDETDNYTAGDSDTVHTTTTTDDTFGDTGNVLAGNYDRTDSTTSTSDVTQSGQRSSAGYSASNHVESTTDTHQTGNTLTGIFHRTVNVTTTTHQAQTAPFSFTDDTKITTDDTQDGNELTGDYSGHGSGTKTETVDESGEGFQVHEEISETTTTDESGNSVAGSFDIQVTLQSHLDMTDQGGGNAGSFNLHETSDQNADETQTGNSIAGNRHTDSSGTETYFVSQNGAQGQDTFSLTINGTRNFSGTEDDDDTTGNYTKADNGTETVTMAESGAHFDPKKKKPQAYNESVTDNATYQMTETGNSASGDFNRTTTGTDKFKLKDTGPGASKLLKQFKTQLSYTLNDTGNYLSGTINLSETGEDRYALLENFFSAATTNGTAGTIDFMAYGRPFVLGKGPVSSGDQGGAVNAGAALGQISDGVLLSMANALAKFVDLGPADYSKACFAAGTFVWTWLGLKPIEKIVKDDLVWSRDENDPNGPLVLKRVEEVFERMAPIMHLHLSPGILRTTREHPFHLRGLGWRTCQELKTGDPLVANCEMCPPVQEVYDTGEVVQVYNFRVEGFHTYFVAGAEDWEFGVWAHNAQYQSETTKTDALANQEAATLHVLGGLYKDVREANPGTGEVHHIPAYAAVREAFGEENVSFENLPGILMDEEDHHQTASYGNSFEAQEWRATQAELIEQGRLEDAIRMDLIDITDKFGAKYDQAIQQYLASLPNELRSKIRF
jgi:hypothetical protein